MFELAVDHDWEIHEALSLGEAREAVETAADECVAACLTAMRAVDGAPTTLLQPLAAVASVAAERAGDADPLELAAALSLCARMIDAASAELDDLSEHPDGHAAAVAARRCVETCRQALRALYEAS